MTEIVAVLWERLTKEIAQSSPLDFLVKLLAAVVVVALAYILKELWAVVSPRLRSWWVTRRMLQSRIATLEGRLKRGLGAVARTDHGTHTSEGTGVWLTRPITCPWSDNEYRGVLARSIPIWVFANLKGGVGKTTNAANLAGYYALRSLNAREKPILLIDGDYQGSLSSMCASDEIRVPHAGHDSLSTRLISGDMSVLELLNAIPVQHPEMVANLPLRVIPAHYDLAQAENRLMVEWLFEKSSVDIRYSLASILHNPLIQEHFSRIVIDAPPRLTTACIQALCAATAVVIPTVLDRLSGEAVGTFLGQLKTLQSAGVCPYLKFGGIIAYNPGRATRYLGDAGDAIADALRKHGLDEHLYINDHLIGHNPLLAESAGTLIGVCRNGPAREVEPLQRAFGDLAAAIEERIASCGQGR